MYAENNLNPTQAKQSSEIETSFAFFLLDNREFGIEVKYVRETIIHKSKLTHMPCSMEVMDGLINLRGAIIPVINLRTRFHINPAPTGTESRIAITQFNGHLFGLLFDEISEVIRLKESEIRAIETSEIDPELCNQGLISLDQGTRIVQLLDLERLFQKYNLPLIDNKLDETRTIFRPRKQDITLILDGQEYAIAVQAIKEIIKPPKIWRKLLVDSAIKGVIDLRGELVNIVDLREYFKLPGTEIGPESRIIILQSSLNCGILVDSVKEVIHYEEDRILPIPIFAEGQEGFIGIVNLDDKRNIIKLDTEQLFDSKLVKHLQGNIELHTDNADKCSDYEQKKENGCHEIDDRVLISFRLGNDYAFDIKLFREIINYPDGIVRIPGLKSFHEGVLNLRNTTIPIINLRQYYGMKDYADIRESKIIILNLEEKIFGIMVDNILEIVKPARMKVDRIPNIAANGQGQKTSNHIRESYRFQTSSGDEKMLLIYDVEQLIRDVEGPIQDDDDTAADNNLTLIERQV